MNQYSFTQSRDCYNPARQHDTLSSNLSYLSISKNDDTNGHCESQYTRQAQHLQKAPLNLMNQRRQGERAGSAPQSTAVRTPVPDRQMRGLGCKGPFYVVYRGRITGIIDEWLKAELSVKGFKNAAHKRINTAEDAFAAWTYWNVKGTVPETRNLVTYRPVDYTDNTWFDTKAIAATLTHAESVVTTSISGTKSLVTMSTSSSNGSTMRQNGDRRYVVLTGPEPGIYDNWKEVEEKMGNVCMLLIGIAYSDDEAQKILDRNLAEDRIV